MHHELNMILGVRSSEQKEAASGAVFCEQCSLS